MTFPTEKKKFLIWQFMGSRGTRLKLFYREPYNRFSFLSPKLDLEKDDLNSVCYAASIIG